MFFSILFVFLYLYTIYIFCSDGNEESSDSEDEEDILQELEVIPSISELSMDALAQLDKIGHKVCRRGTG